MRPMPDELSPTDLSHSTDDLAHREACAVGLRHWHWFTESCLDRTGPAGVLHRGARLSRLRVEAQATTQGEAASDPLDLVIALIAARMEMASSHLAATAALLTEDPAFPSVPVVLRAWSEASARAMWLLDPTISAREATERALTDWLAEADEIRKLRSDRAPESPTARRGRTDLDALVLEVAKSVSVEPKPRPPAAIDLIQRYAGVVENQFPAEVARAYRRSSGVVHSRFLAWAAAVVGRTGKDGVGLVALRPFMTEALTALTIHMKALDAWNDLQEWSPQDLFEEARRVSIARVWHPFLELEIAVRRSQAQ